jgi:hypothetical protein
MWVIGCFDVGSDADAPPNMLRFGRRIRPDATNRYNPKQDSRCGPIQTTHLPQIS